MSTAHGQFLCKLGFQDKDARKASASLKETSRATRVKELLVEVLAVLVPAPTTWMVRDASRPRWLSRAPFAWPGAGLDPTFAS